MAIVFGVCLVVGMVPLLGSLAFLLSILVAVVGGNIAALWLLIRTFQIDTTAGLLSIFVPFYQIYFAYQNYQQLREPVLALALTVLPFFACLLGMAIQLLVFMAIGAIQ